MIFKVDLLSFQDFKILRQVLLSNTFLSRNITYFIKNQKDPLVLVNFDICYNYSEVDSYATQVFLTSRSWSPRLHG